MKKMKENTDDELAVSELYFQILFSIYLRMLIVFRDGRIVFDFCRWDSLFTLQSLQMEIEVMNIK